MSVKPAERPPWSALAIGLMAVDLGRLAFPDDWGSTFALLTAVTGYVLVGRYVDGALRWLKERP